MQAEWQTQVSQLCPYVCACPCVRTPTFYVCTPSTVFVISSASGTEGGEVFYGPTDWLGSHNPMTHYDYTPDSLLGLDD
jgi:hypothetical protein